MDSVIAFILRTLGAPRINDITTDWEDPPRFHRDGAAALAASSYDALDYPPRFAAVQQANYPGLRTHTLSCSMAKARERVAAAIEAFGWTVTYISEADAGHDGIASPDRARVEHQFEATQTSRWCRFTDDIVIRLRAGEPGRIVLDARSRSRVGRSDFGVNAARLRAFVDTV